MTFKTGWAFEHEDKAFLARFTSKAFPKAFRVAPVLQNLNYDWLRVENQGQLGSCQGHGLSTALEVLHFNATGQKVQLSRLYAYLRTQQMDGLLGSDCGSTIAGGVKVAMQVGLPPEELVPYSDVYPSQSRIASILTPENESAAHAIRVKSGVPIHSYDDALAWVSGLGVISIGTKYDFERDASCVVRRWRPTGNGGHARCICEIENGLLGDLGSWGAGYLRNGRQYWTPDAFNQMLADPSSVVIGLNDMERPAPRKLDFNTEVWK